MANWRRHIGWLRLSLVGWLGASLVMVACGGSSPPAAQHGGGETGTSPTPHGPVLVTGPVAFQFMNAFLIDEDGRVFSGVRLIGVLSPEGHLVNRGQIVARIDAGGWLWRGESRTALRVVGLTLVQVLPEMMGNDTPFMRIENGGLVTDETHEAIPIEGFRPELAREVLFVIGLVTMEMASGMGR